MFIGRIEEQKMLERFYNSNRFEFLVLYGRRRIGKTFLLRHFFRNRDCIFFSAMEKNDTLNRKNFTSTLKAYFNEPFLATFENWQQAFDYMESKAEDRKLCLIIDEFPYIIKENPSVKSTLQHKIDLSWIDSNLKLILCGSNMNVMETEVLGYESPLYGRSTMQWELKEFDYLTASEFFPNYSNKDKLIAYGILGGIPRYLAEFDPNVSLKDNIRDRILTPGSFLYEEPKSFLKMILRQTSLYNSILEVISRGENRINEIASAVQVQATSINKYIGILQTLRLITRTAPCTEAQNGKKGTYSISDNFFRFWYRYLSANNNHYDLIGPDKATEEIMDNINDYMGPAFENIAMQYLKREARKGRLPFVPYYAGRWWGTNKKLKAQDDIDVLIMDKDRKNGLFAECKFKNSKFTSKDLDDILDSFAIFPSIQNHLIYVFSISGWTEEVKERASSYNARLITLDDLFRK